MVNGQGLTPEQIAQHNGNLSLALLLDPLGDAYKVSLPLGGATVQGRLGGELAHTQEMVVVVGGPKP